MIILLYGPDSYRRQKQQQWIVALYRTKHSSLTIEQFDIEDNGVFDSEAWGRLNDCIKKQSLFDPHILVRVRGVYAIADNTEFVVWLASLRDAPGITVLLSADSAPPKPLAFLIQKPTVCTEYKLLRGLAFKKFVEAEVVSRGAHISDEELAELGVLYRDDVWGLMTELDMLALAPRASRIAHRVFLRRDFFTLVKDIAYGSSRDTLPALEELLHNEDPSKIFNMLAALVSGEKKAQMADYDVAVKSGRLDYEAVLLDFAIR